MVREGVDTAVERINAAGGVNGKKLETVVIDDGCEQAGSGGRQPRGQQQDRFRGRPRLLGRDHRRRRRLQQRRRGHGDPSATSPALTDGKNYEFIFRTIGRDDQQGPAAAKFVLEKLKPKKVAVLHDKQSYGQGIATAVKNDLEKGGIPVAIFEGINAGDSDYSAVITKLKSGGVDFVYYGGYHPKWACCCARRPNRA